MYAFKEINYSLTAGDFDQYNNLHLYSLGNYFQDSAAYHASFLGFGYEEMIAKNYAWIIARNRFTFIKPIKDIRDVKVQTWPRTPSRFDFDRDYLMFDSNDNLLAKGRSKWVVFDLNKKFIASPKGLMDHLEFHDGKSYDEPIKKIVINEEDKFTHLLTHKVTPFELDHYNHLNNARYLAIIYDALRLKEEEVVREVEVNYINQSRLDDVIEVYGKRDDKTFTLIGKINDVLTFTSIVNLF